MKILTSLLFIALLTVGVKAQTFDVNSSKSNVKWTGQKVTGKHFGTVKVGVGELMVKGDDITGNFAIDMTSLTVDDIDASEGGDKLLGHLKSDDFFAVDNHPTASLRVTGAKRIYKSDANFELMGKLAIKGIEHDVTIPAKIVIEGNQLKATATFSIDRTLWDIKYNSGSFFSGLGDYLIYDDILFDVDLTAVAKSQQLKK